jgi:hypothetical protein
MGWGDRNWRPLSSGCGELKGVWDVKLKTLPHLIPNLRIYGSIILSPILLHDEILRKLLSFEFWCCAKLCG